LSRGSTSQAASASVSTSSSSVAGRASSSGDNQRTPTVRRQFGAVIGTPTTPVRSPSDRVVDTDDGPRLEDLYYSEVTSLPDECEVTDPDLQDELLKDMYKDLPKLRCVLFVCYRLKTLTTLAGLVRSSRGAKLQDLAWFDSLGGPIFAVG
jgi:hypothetical protein